jgi:hypothetical protein
VAPIDALTATKEQLTMYPTDTLWDSMILALFALCQDEVEHVTLSEGCDVCEAPRQYLPHGDTL